MRLFVLLLSLLYLFDVYSVVHCKRFSRCGLAKEIKKQGFKDLRNWVCLIEAESGRKTDVIGKPNKDKSRDYGLFQINSRYWCSEGPKLGKDCNVKCKDLLKDNISVASKCAKKIFARHAFEAWYGWKNKCKGKRLPDLSKCKL